jgi:hypothetical protein
MTTIRVRPAFVPLPGEDPAGPGPAAPVDDYPPDSIRASTFSL